MLKGDAKRWDIFLKFVSLGKVLNDPYHSGVNEYLV